MYRKTILKNGLRIITAKLSQRESLGMGIWIGVGGRYEDVAKKGIAHFLEHIVFKGSKNYSCDKIKQSIEGIGGSLNGFTSEEFTCYLTKVPAKYLTKSLDVLLDMVFNPLILDKDIHKEKTVIIEEIKMYKDQPQHYVQELLDFLLWPEHPLGMNLSGSIETVKAIAGSDLWKFKQQYYLPHNIVIAASGALEHLEFCQQILSRIPKNNYPDKDINFLPASPLQNKPRFKFLFKEVEQTHLALGIPALRRDHPDRHTFGLLNIILGANMSSRLFHEVREKRGLAYEIGSHIKRFKDTGAFLVQAGVDNNKVDEALQVILAELDKIKQEKLKVDEFSRAKEYYTGQLMLALEDTLDHMLWIGEQVIALDRVYSLKEVLGLVNKIKIDDLQRVAQDIFQKQRYNLSLIGPLKPAQEKKVHNLILNKE